jgi:hypothetical protein
VARKKTPIIRVGVRASLSRRLREIRQELFGDHGGPELARRLNLPVRTWYNYETGVTVPAEVLLAFIEQTGVNPTYLIAGEGPRYRRPNDERLLSELAPVELIRRGLEKLDRASSGVVVVAPDNLPTDVASDFAAVSLYPLSEIVNPVLDPSKIEGHVIAYRGWLPNPAQTIGVRMADDAMHPILPVGSIAAIDRSLTDPLQLHGRIVAACHEGTPILRWGEVSGHHLILRANKQAHNFPLVLIDREGPGPMCILGQVVWSWSWFSER